MSLPIIMKKGFVSIYDVGRIGVANLNAPPNYSWGILNQTWYNDAYPPFTGASVMFDVDNAINVVYNNLRYSIVKEDKIIFIENDFS